MAKRLSREEKLLVQKLVSWAAPYAPMLAVPAMELAHAAPVVAKAVKWAYDRDIFDQYLCGYDESRFFDYYTSKGELLADCLNIFDPSCEADGAKIDQLLRLLSPLAARAAREAFLMHTPEELRQQYQAGRKIAARHVARCARDLVRGPRRRTDRSDQEQAELIRESTAFSFLLRIAAPYWVHFGVWPDEAFRLASDATKPNLARLKELVRVDPRVVHHTGLRPVIHPDASQVESRRWLELRKAMGNPISPPTPSVVKRRFASLISEMSLRLQPKRIKPSKINELFDLVARCPDPVTEETRLGELVDKDMPVGDDLRSAIKHYASHFELPPKPDRDFFIAVRTLNRWFADDSGHGKAA